MAADMKKDEEMEIALVQLHYLNSKFLNKIQEMNCLKLSLEDTLDEGTTVSEHDYNLLQTMLKELCELKEKYDNVVETFLFSFGSLASSEAGKVDNAFREAVGTFYRLKVDVERLIRRLKRNLRIEEEAKETNEPFEDLSDNEEDEKIDKGKGLWKKVVIGVLIAITFYACLGAVIKHVLTDRAKSAITGDVFD